jgi:glycosyltransferase involved in cell wall biosynthesis
VSAVLQEGKYFVLPQKAPIASKAGTVIAAIAHGLILISTGSRKDPTETEPFKHLINCYLIYDMSPGNLARAVGELASSPDVQKKITKGLNELSHYFSWDNITQRHLELYEKDK